MLNSLFRYKIGLLSSHTIVHISLFIYISANQLSGATYKEVGNGKQCSPSPLVSPPDPGLLHTGDCTACSALSKFCQKQLTAVRVYGDKRLPYSDHCRQGSHRYVHIY